MGMTPGNVDALASDELEFNDTSRWVDENVPQIRVPSVIIGALGDQVVEIDPCAAIGGDTAGHRADHSRRQPRDSLHAL